MAILSVGEIALLLGDSYQSLEDYMFSNAEGASRLKWQWDRYENFDLSSTMIRTKLELFVSSGVITRTDLDRVYTENDIRDEAILPRLNPLNTRPTVSLFDVKNGKGYQINYGYMKVRQEYAPAVSGNYNMTEEQATILGNYIADKMFAGLNPTVTHQQVQDIWDGIKTSDELIAEEITSIGLVRGS